MKFSGTIDLENGSYLKCVCKLETLPLAAVEEMK